MAVCRETNGNMKIRHSFFNHLSNTSDHPKQDISVNMLDRSFPRQRKHEIFMARAGLRNIKIFWSGHYNSILRQEALNGRWSGNNVC